MAVGLEAGTEGVSAEARARAAQIPVVDFDIEYDPRFRQDPLGRFTEALEIGPIFYSIAARGFWTVTQYDLIGEIVHRPDQFSSREVLNFYREPLGFRDIPTQLDPPDHIPIRRLIQPYLSPAAVEKLEPSIRAVTRRLLGELASQSGCEFNYDFAERLPLILVMMQLGLPLERERELATLNLIVQYPDGLNDPGYKEHRKAAKALDDLWAQVIPERRAQPRDDWVSNLIRSELNGKPLSDEILLGLLLVLLRAGFDTTAGTLTYAFQHLAVHPESRKRLRAEPSAIPAAVEEFLRCYGGSPIISRIVTGDFDFHRIPMRDGDRLVLLLGTANRDPKAFNEPGHFDMGRTPNKHLSFGLGQHRCAGMHLARAELRIAFEEWHRCIPDYHLGDMAGVNHQVSQDVHLSALPLVFDRVLLPLGGPAAA